MNELDRLIADFFRKLRGFSPTMVALSFHRAGLPLRTGAFLALVVKTADNEIRTIEATAN